MVQPTNKKKLYEEQVAAAASSPAIPTPVPSANPPKIIVNVKTRYVVRPNQYSGGCWMKSPAMMEIFKATDAALVDIAEQRGFQTTQVKKIRAAKLETDKKVYIYPTEDEDEDGLELKRTRGKVTCNLISFLAQNNLCVETGYKERFVIIEAGPDSPVGPALVFDMSKPAARELLPKSQARKSAVVPPATPPAPAPESDPTDEA